MLDGVSPAPFEQNFFFVVDELASRANVVRNVLDGRTLIALDGSEYYCSKKLSCPSCSKRKRSDGSEDYFHAFLGATVVRYSDQKVFCLPPEFIQPQDGYNKQDSELRAARRWLARMAPHCMKYNPVYLGDDLYAKHDMCSTILRDGGSFIFTCKDTSHKTLHAFRKGLIPSTHMEIHGKGSQKREYHYSWIYSLPIRDSAEAILVNWIDVKIVNPKGKTTYHASFITNKSPDKDNISELIACARARWKIENETFNVLKNNGYHLEHNSGHGQQTLSALLVTLNLLAFTMHNACNAAEVLWQRAREARGARSRLFIHLWTITTYHVFQTWNSLMKTIMTGRPPPSP
ncbi:transposase [Desulfovibrio sp. OttesenSCG-928-M14]|nr:transposase [Desulfovibrio sp. OttesenSCG-928-M14]